MNRLVILWLLFITFIGELNSEKSSWNCQFYEESRYLTIDFTKLYNKENDYILYDKINNEKLRIQLCGPLKEMCNNVEGYSACLSRGNKELGLGRVPHYSHEDGKIIFKYSGDKCKDSINYTLYVTMMCDNSAKISYPQLISNNQNQCTIFIIWRSILACAHLPSPVPSVNCTIKSKDGKIYDLSALTKLATNYRVLIDNTSTIILNVCHPVNYEHGAVCSDDAGACLRIHSDKISYQNIGTVKSLELIENTPTLHYDSGNICSSGTHMETTISFICDYNAYNTTPVLTKTDNCHFHLSWRTSVACIEKNLAKNSSKTATSCKITNPVTNTEYNLDTLKGQDYIVRSKSDTEYKFSICGPLSSNSCSSKTSDSKEAGVCSSVNSTIGGKANSELLWNVTGPYLKYTDGDLCGKNKSLSTIISFVCPPEGSNYINSIVDDEPCHIHIYYFTQFVCEKKSVIHSTFFSNLNIIIIIIILIGVSITLYLLNSERRKYLISFCHSRYFRGTNPQMHYSRINTFEETDALLDAPDTHCQSDSDDDLLRI